MTGAAPSGGVDADMPEPPYMWVGKWALMIKAFIQMAVGLATVIAVFVHVIQALSPQVQGGEWASQLGALQTSVFSIVGVGLALAAAVELAYTLFTHGPDEALDPALLAVSAALIIQLGSDTNGVQWQDSLTTLLLVLAIAGLFATRRWVAQLRERSVADQRPDLRLSRRPPAS